MESHNEEKMNVDCRKNGMEEKQSGGGIRGQRGAEMRSASDRIHFS